MVKIRVDHNINGDTPELKGTTSDKPRAALIKKVEIILANDLPEQFANRDNDRYQLTILLGSEQEEYTWLPNKTSLKSIVAVHGDESDNWIDKEIGIFLVEQNVSGKMKKVPYAIAG